MAPTILIYNFNNPKIRRTLQMLSIKSGIRIKSVEPGQYGMKIGDLLEGKSMEDTKKVMETFDEEMMVFANVSGPALNHFLGQMAKNKIPRVPLKAMLTEQNATWDSLTLYKELKEEDAKLRNK